MLTTISIISALGTSYFHGQQLQQELEWNPFMHYDTTTYVYNYTFLCYIYIYICIYIYMCVCVYICMCVWYTCKHICIYIYVCVCVCVSVIACNQHSIYIIYIYIYICIYGHLFNLCIYYIFLYQISFLNISIMGMGPWIKWEFPRMDVIHKKKIDT